MRGDDVDVGEADVFHVGVLGLKLDGAGMLAVVRKGTGAFEGVFVNLDDLRAEGIPGQRAAQIHEDGVEAEAGPRHLVANQVVVNFMTLTSEHPNAAGAINALHGVVTDLLVACGGFVVVSS